MQRRGSRSSLHYDPFHNLLCVLRGSKTLRLFTPEATRWLRPLPLHGESPNHCGVSAAAAPDLVPSACQLSAALQARGLAPHCCLCSR